MPAVLAKHTFAITEHSLDSPILLPGHCVYWRSLACSPAAIFTISSSSHQQQPGKECWILVYVVPSDDLSIVHVRLHTFSYRRTTTNTSHFTQNLHWTTYREVVAEVLVVLDCTLDGVSLLLCRRARNWWPALMVFEKRRRCRSRAGTGPTDFVNDLEGCTIITLMIIIPLIASSHWYSSACTRIIIIIAIHQRIWRQIGSLEYNNFIWHTLLSLHFLCCNIALLYLHSEYTSLEYSWVTNHCSRPWV